MMRLTLSILVGATLMGSGMLSQMSSDAPAARGGHAMIYDSEHGLTLMFGGGNRQQSFNDLWAWNGDRWRKLAESGPSPRNSAAFVYDSHRRQAVVVGGEPGAAWWTTPGNGTARPGVNEKWPGPVSACTILQPSTRNVDVSSCTVACGRSRKPWSG
jgi:hypothetical protein